MGYEGTITFEAFSAPATAAELAGRLAVWRCNWDDPMDVAVRTRSYMQAVLAAARHGDPEPPGVASVEP